MEKNRKKIVWAVFFIALYAAFGIMAYRMFLHQAVRFKGPMGRYYSDLPAHIKAGREGLSYNVMMTSFAFIIDTLGLGEEGVAAFLALFTIGTTFVTYLVMISISPQADRPVLHLLAFVSSFVMPIYLPFLNKNRYLGMQAGTIWHNSTYLGMKFAAMLLLLFYYKYQEKYQKEFRVSDFVCFTALLIFVNSIKPNFFIAFAPAMAVMLLTDCIASRGKSLPRQILFGIPVLLSLTVVVWEARILFEGRNAGSSIAFTWGYSLRIRNRHPVAALFQSGAFPYFVFLANARTFFTDRTYRVSWLTWFFSMCEYLFLVETGRRRDHGNLSWGVCFCMFLIFVICICQYYRNVTDWIRGYKKSGERSAVSYVRSQGIRGCLRAVYLVTAAALLAWHLFCGLQYSWFSYLGARYTI